MQHLGKLLTTSALAIIAQVTLAHAEPVTLKIAHPYADNHYLSEQGLKVWAEEVTKLTNGEVQFEYYPAGQLGKAQVSLLQTGLADISILVPSQEVDALPMSSVMELPGLVSSSCEGARKFTAIGTDDGYIAQQELTPQGLRLLYTNMLPPYALMTKTRPVRTLEDMSGLKLRANGQAVGETMRELGAIPVTIPSGAIYESISRGTIDGAFFPQSAIKPYSLEDQLKYITTGVALGGAGSLVTISENTWQELTPEVQAAMQTAAGTAQENLCKWLDADAQTIMDEVSAENGVEIITLSSEEAERWYERISGAVDVWVKQMEGLRKDGQAALAAFRDVDGGA